MYADNELCYLDVSVGRDRARTRTRAREKERKRERERMTTTANLGGEVIETTLQRSQLRVTLLGNFLVWLFFLCFEGPVRYLWHLIRDHRRVAGVRACVLWCICVWWVGVGGGVQFCVVVWFSGVSSEYLGF